MKMSDIWGWDAIPQNYGHYTKEQIADYPDGNYYGFLFVTEEAAEGVAHAVREHDTLTETNRLLNLECKELKKDIEAMKKAIDDLSERVVFPALALAKLDYPNSSKAAMDMTDWRSFMSKIKYDK